MLLSVPARYRRRLVSCFVQARIARVFGRYSLMTESMNEAVAVIDRMVHKHVITRSAGIRLYRRLAA